MSILDEKKKKKLWKIENLMRLQNDTSFTGSKWRSAAISVMNRLKRVNGLKPKVRPPPKKPSKPEKTLFSEYFSKKTKRKTY